MRLTSKLTAALSLTIFSVIGTYTGLTLHRQEQNFEYEMSRDGHVLGRALVTAIRWSWLRDGEAAALTLLAAMDHEQPRVSVKWAWIDPPVPGSPELPAPARARLEANLDAIVVDPPGTPTRYLRTYVPFRVPDGRMGALEIAESLADRDAYLSHSLLLLALLTAALLAFAALVTHRVGRWLVGQPVERLVGKARRVGLGDLADPLVLSSSEEFETLGREMNAMCENLARIQEALAEEGGARKEAEVRLRRAERLATVGTLAAGLAHELGTPLNVISGRARLIELGPGTGDERVDWSRTIREQSQRITSIVRELLDFARPREPLRHPIDLDDVIAGCVRLVTGLDPRPGIRIEHTRSARPLRIAADPAQVQQVVTNLLLNAVQSLPGDGTIAVETREVDAVDPDRPGAVARRYARADVIDTGKGIDPADLARIFEPFFTTKEAGQGTGLGLSVAWGIVKEHGGFIEVESQKGKGSRFSVHLAIGEAA